jgi:hypothetical protein
VFCYPLRLGVTGRRLAVAGVGARSIQGNGRSRVHQGLDTGVRRRVTYLVIIVLVAAAGVIRLWLQQRRQVSQMDTIEGFSSALEAMAPKFARRGARDSRARRRAGRRRSLKGWLIAQPAHARRRMAVRRDIEARRVSSHRIQRAHRTRSRRASSRAVGRGSEPSARRSGEYANRTRSQGRRATPPRRIDRGRSSGQQGWVR